MERRFALWKDQYGSLSTQVLLSFFFEFRTEASFFEGMINPD
jgi:hypothetical protein